MFFCKSFVVSLFLYVARKTLRKIDLLFQVLHISGQIDILQSWLAEFIPREIENKQESIIIAANKIILKHQKIIQFSENIESLYTHIALLLFASNTMLICSLGFLIVTVSKIIN